MSFILQVLLFFLLETCTDSLQSNSNSASSEVQNNIRTLGVVYLGEGFDYTTYQYQQTTLGNFPLNSVPGIYIDINQEIPSSVIENFNSNCTINNVFNVNNNKGIIVYVTSLVDQICTINSVNLKTSDGIDFIIPEISLKFTDNAVFYKYSSTLLNNEIEFDIVTNKVFTDYDVSQFNCTNCIIQSVSLVNKKIIVKPTNHTSFIAIKSTAFAYKPNSLDTIVTTYVLPEKYDEIIASVYYGEGVEKSSYLEQPYVNEFYSIPEGINNRVVA